ncbi:hypothetical protein ACNIZK_28795, partial [Citrobacter portucalensis]
ISFFQADPLFTLANLFRVDQMIRQWERSQ